MSSLFQPYYYIFIVQYGIILQYLMTAFLTHLYYCENEYFNITLPNLHHIINKIGQCSFVPTTQTEDERQILMLELNISIKVITTK